MGPTAKTSAPQQKTSPWLWPLLILIVIGSVFAVVEATSGGSGSAAKVADYDQRPQDVTIKSCTVADGRLKGSIEVTNGTSVSSTYAVKLTFQSPDGKIQYDTGTAIVTALDPGQSSGAQPVAVAKRVGDVPVKCQLAGAARYSA
jgi:hypothetical protein